MKVKIWLITALMACLWCIVASRGTSGAIDEQGSMVPPTVEQCERDYACQNWQSASQFCATGEGTGEKECLCSSGNGDAMRDCVYCMEDTIEGLEWQGLSGRAYTKYSSYCKDRTIDVDEFKSRGFKLTIRSNFPLVFFTGNYYTPWVWAHAKAKELQRRLEPRVFDKFSTVFSVETHSVAAQTSTVEVVISQQTITAEEPTSTIATTLFVPGVPTSPPFPNATTSATTSSTTSSDLQTIPAATSTVSFQVPQSEVLPTSLFTTSSIDSSTITPPQIESSTTTSTESTSTTLTSLLKSSITSVIMLTSVVQSTSIMTSIVSVSMTSGASPIPGNPGNLQPSQLLPSLTFTPSTLITVSTTEPGGHSSSLSSTSKNLITAEPSTLPTTSETQIQSTGTLPTASSDNPGTTLRTITFRSSTSIVESTLTLQKPSASTSWSAMLSSVLSSVLDDTSIQNSATPHPTSSATTSTIMSDTTFDSQSATTISVDSQLGLTQSRTSQTTLNTSPSTQILSISSPATTVPAAPISILTITSILSSNLPSPTSMQTLTSVLTITIPTPSQISPPIQSSASSPSISISRISATTAVFTTLSNPPPVITISVGLIKTLNTTVSTATIKMSPTSLAGPAGMTTTSFLTNSGGCAGSMPDCVISWDSFGSTSTGRSGYTINPTTSSGGTSTQALSSKCDSNPENTVTHTITQVVTQGLSQANTEPLSCIDFSTLPYIYSSTLILNSPPPTPTLTPNPTPTPTHTTTSTLSTLLAVPSAFLTYPSAPSNTNPNTSPRTSSPPTATTNTNTNPYPGSKTGETITSPSPSPSPSNSPLTLSIIPFLTSSSSSTGPSSPPTINTNTNTETETETETKTTNSFPLSTSTSTTTSISTSSTTPIPIPSPTSQTTSTTTTSTSTSTSKATSHHRTKNYIPLTILIWLLGPVLLL